MSRERERDRRQADRYNNDAELRARRDSKTSTDYYKNRNSDRPTSGEKKAEATLKALDRNAPDTNPYSDGPREFKNAEERENYLRKRLMEEKDRMKAAEERERKRKENMRDANETTDSGRRVVFMPGIGFRTM